MKAKNIFLILFFSLFCCACTTVPSRFTKTPDISKDGGYFVEYEDNTGFFLETFFKSYSFVPNADDNIQEAKTYFVKVAQMISEDKNKPIKPILKSQLRADSTRNILDGYYAINVSGKVEYK